MKVSQVETHSASGPWLGLGGSRVVVAGAGGLGSTCAQAYLAQGARVLLVDRDKDRLAKVDELAAQVGRSADLYLHTADLTEAGAGEAVVAAANDHLGGIDVLFHAVGVNDRRPVLEIDPADWEHVLRVNLSSAYGLCRAAGRQMVDQGHGRIVVVSSVSGLLAHAHHAPYAASKGGLNQMMRVMAREWAASGVTVNAVAPGYVETELTADYLERPGVREELTRLVPTGRLGVPDQVVGPVLFLSSTQAEFVTGHVLYVDGGRTLV